MHKQFYFLSPVEVVKVTSSNLEEVAEWCGGSVQETESRRNPGKMDKYVWVPTPKGNRISWAFPGMFITKRLVLTMKDELKETWAVYRRDYFEKNYFDSPGDAVDATWERQIAEVTTKKAEPVEVVVHMGEVMAEAMERVSKAGKKEVEPVEVEVSVNGVTLDKPEIKPIFKKPAKKVAVKKAGSTKVTKVDDSEIEDVPLLDSEVAITG